MSYAAQAQRGERRGQSRRQRRQPEQQLRRRGRDARIRPCSAARSHARATSGAADAEPGRADAAGRRRASCARSTATTTPIARTTSSAGSTGRASKRSEACCASRARSSRCASAIRRCGAQRFIRPASAGPDAPRLLWYDETAASPTGSRPEARMLAFTLSRPCARRAAAARDHEHERRRPAASPSPRRGPTLASHRRHLVRAAPRTSSPPTTPSRSRLPNIFAKHNRSRSSKRDDTCESVA